MKKTLLLVAAAVALVACSNEETVHQSAPEAIGFDNAFVENSTRSVNDPSFTNTNLFGGFRVYGFVENAPLFKGTEVTGSGLGNTGSWSYQGTQYWIAGANYKFHAVAPIPAIADADNATYTVADGVSFNYTNVDGTEDLLYAYQTATGLTTNNQKVAFTFDHILSKVKFSFVNGYDASNATLKVTNVKITNAHKTANVALNNTTVTWTGNNGETDNDLDFGAATDREDTTAAANYAFGSIYESDNERFVLPSTAEYEYAVTFTVELWINDVQVDVDSTTTGVQGYNHTATAKFAPVAGNAYDIKTTITASNIDPDNAQEAIEFTVTRIDDWDTDYNDDAEGDNNIDM